MDHHKKPYDQGTLLKLDIFEKYTEAWLPTFVMARPNTTLVIIDFFSGMGYDKNGEPGSSIRILKVIKKFVRFIFQNKITLEVYFNEYDTKKYKKLCEACDAFLEDNKEVKRAISKIEYQNFNFEDSFKQLYPKIKAHPSLVFIDQNGIKFLNVKYFKWLEKTQQTDFLYFVSSSYFIRFGEMEEFTKHFKLDLEEAKKFPYKFIHEQLLIQLRKKLPEKTTLRLYPFTLKKKANIYGLIFGAHHVRAVDKFLEVAWKINPINGTANFDIDDDKKVGQLDLFNPIPRLTKIQVFENRLLKGLEKNKELSNKQIYYATLALGHPTSHADGYLRMLKRDKKITYDGKSPKIKYKYIAKNADIVTIKFTQKTNTNDKDRMDRSYMEPDDRL